MPITLTTLFAVELLYAVCFVALTFDARVEQRDSCSTTFASHEVNAIAIASSHRDNMEDRDLLVR